MAPLSRAAILSLAGLTIHFSVLSIVLHISRHAVSDRPRYHPSSAVALTEALKIAISTALVFWTGELRPRVEEKRKQRYEPIEDVTEEPAWMEGSGNAGGGGAQREPEKAHEWVVEAPAIPIQKRRGGQGAPTTAHSRSSSLNINISLAQNLYPISVAVIPATPAGPVSPLRTPTSGGLYPNHRSPTRLPVAVDPDWGILEKDSWVALKETVFGPGWWKLAIPSILFVFQANAQYLASGNLSVPTFQLAYQLKIPATALCSVLLLNRVLSPQQWISLFILTLGVGIVQLHSAAPAPHLPSSPATPLNLDSHPAPNPVLGLVAVMAACLSSGFASTYFERMLKKPASSTDENEGSQSQPSLWIRNIQLSLFGLAAGLPIVWYEMQGGWTKGDDGRSLSLEGGWMGGAMETSRVLAGSFFEGFDEMTWAVIGLQVMGGLLAALVMQHADNIAKCFSTSISIILSFIASVYLFNFHVSFGVAFGASLVLLSTWAYAQPASWRSRARGASRPTPLLNGEGAAAK